MTSLELRVSEVTPKQTHEWLEKKHYAHAIPLIQHAFALWHKGRMVGVCTMGPPPRVMNMGASIFDKQIEIPTFELNRLVTNDDLPANSLSFFVARCIRMMPKPSVIVSYADANQGHHGYIYQATSWLYAGETLREPRYINTQNGKVLHPRTVYSMFGTRDIERMPSHIEIVKEDKPKHRYFKLNGTKRQRKRMMKHFKYEHQPYPKGENQNYVPGQMSSTTASFDGWFD